MMKVKNPSTGRMISVEGRTFKKLGAPLPPITRIRPPSTKKSQATSPKPRTSLLEERSVLVYNQFIKIYFKRYLNLNNIKKELNNFIDILWQQGRLSPEQYKEQKKYIEENIQLIRNYVDNAIDDYSFTERNTGKVRKIENPVDIADFINEVESIRRALYWNIANIGVFVQFPDTETVEKLSKYCKKSPKAECKAPCEKSIIRGCVYKKLK